MKALKFSSTCMCNCFFNLETFTCVLNYLNFVLDTPGNSQYLTVIISVTVIVAVVVITLVTVVTVIVRRRNKRQEIT